MKKIIIAALLSVFVAAPAVAADAAGIYAGVKLGPSDVAGSTLGFGVYGGYNIDPSVTSKMTSSDFMSKVSFAGEAEYTSFGSNSSGAFTYKASAIGVVVAATYPINPQFSVIAKAGLARTAYDVTCSGCGPFWNYTTNTIGLRAGAAGQYNLTQQIGLRAGLDFYPDGYNMLSAGAVIKF